MAAAGTRVAVFIDWQNVYNAARRAFGWGQGWPNEYGNFSPYQLSRILAAGNGRGKGAQLVRVEVHRGIPASSRDPTGFGANRRQAAAWVAESSLVVPKLRPLRYPRAWPKERPEEKGVDVDLALSLVEAVTLKQCDVAVLFTHDTDLVPAIDTAARLRGSRCVETASWVSSTARQRLRSKTTPVFHHEISQDVFDLVRDPTNYAQRPKR